MMSFWLTVIRLLKAIVRSWDKPHFKAALFLASTILFSGSIFYRTVEGWSWVDAFYFSVTTMSTVGLGDLAPQTTVGKLFTVFYIFVGVGVFVLLLAQFARALLQVQDDE